MTNRVILRPGEDVKIQIKTGISVPKDIIHTVILLPLFERGGLKLAHYKFITNGTAAGETPWRLKLN